MADQPPPMTAQDPPPARFVGSSEDGEATIIVWPNAGGEISIWLEEEYRKEGQPGLYSVDALCSLPRPVAATLGRRLRDLAGGEPPDAALALLRRFRDAIDAASVAYHAGDGQVGGVTLPLLAFERAVRLAQTALQDELDALDKARGRAVTMAEALAADNPILDPLGDRLHYPGEAQYESWREEHRDKGDLDALDAAREG